VINTPYVVFHETTNGPFDRAETEFAPWAPAEGEPEAAAFTESVRRRIAVDTAQAA
jgi:hypothetical protein